MRSRRAPGPTTLAVVALIGIGIALPTAAGAATSAVTVSPDSAVRDGAPLAIAGTDISPVADHWAVAECLAKATDVFRGCDGYVRTPSAFHFGGASVKVAADGSLTADLPAKRFISLGTGGPAPLRFDCADVGGSCRVDLLGLPEGSPFPKLISGPTLSFTTASAAPVVDRIAPARGSPAGGSFVQITGRHLAGTTHVAFGHVVLTVASGFVHVDSGTSLHVATPAGPPGSTVGVRVTSTAGTSSSSLFHYAVGPTQPPSIVEPGSEASSIGGDVVDLFGVGLTDTYEVDFGSTVVPRAYIHVDSDREVSVMAPPGPAGTTVDVRVVTPLGISPASTEHPFSWVDRTTSIATIAGLSPDDGPARGGQLVVLRGSGLQGVTGVAVGNAVVRVPYLDVVSDTCLVFLTPPVPAPAGPETVNVEVLKQSGVSDQIDSSYTYDPAASATGG